MWGGNRSGGWVDLVEQDEALIGCMGAQVVAAQKAKAQLTRAGDPRWIGLDAGDPMWPGRTAAAVWVVCMGTWSRQK